MQMSILFPTEGEWQKQIHELTKPKGLQPRWNNSSLGWALQTPAKLR